jgi:hypothetical protein
MDEKRIARLRAHQKNIELYQSLLKTKLSEVETQFLERRLSEERFSLAMLDCMAPPSMWVGLPGTPRTAGAQ